MKITILMATYNGEAFIEEQMASFFVQTRRFDELLIVDDASTDSSLPMIHELLLRNEFRCNSETADTTAEIVIYEHAVGQRVVVRKNRENLGFRLNFLSGLCHTTGDIIFYADQDDVWFPEKIDTMYTAMAENPEMLSLSSKVVLIDENGEAYPENAYVYKTAKAAGQLPLCNDGALAEVPYKSPETLASQLDIGSTECIRKRLIADFMIDGAAPAHDTQTKIFATLRNAYYRIDLALMARRIHYNNVSTSKHKFVFTRKLETPLDRAKRTENEALFNQYLARWAKQNRHEDVLRIVENSSKSGMICRKRVALLRGKSFRLALDLRADIGPCYGRMRWFADIAFTFFYPLLQMSKAISEAIQRAGMRRE